MAKQISLPEPWGENNNLTNLEKTLADNLLSKESLEFQEELANQESERRQENRFNESLK